MQIFSARRSNNRFFLFPLTLALAGCSSGTSTGDPEYSAGLG